MATKTNKTKTCSNGAFCSNIEGAKQPVTNYHRYSRSKDGLKPECKSCRLSYQASYDASRAPERAIKRKVYAAFMFNDERAIAYNYLANKLGVKTKRLDPIVVDENSLGLNDTTKAYIRGQVKKTFTTKDAQRVAFNLISYQLGQTARA